MLPLPSSDFGISIALDKNLLIANPGSSVEVVDAPSYSTVNATIVTRFACADNVRLNKSKIWSIDAALKAARKTQKRDGTSRFIEGG